MSQIDVPETVDYDDPKVLKGLVAGTIGGLVASWVMNEFQYAWIKVAGSMTEARQNGSNDVAKQSQSSDQEPATIKAAEMISERSSAID